MDEKPAAATLWKVTDALGELLKQYQTQDLATIFFEQQTRQQRLARLCYCFVQPGVAWYDQRWYLFEQNYDPQTGELKPPAGAGGELGGVCKVVEKITSYPMLNFLTETRTFVGEPGTGVSTCWAGYQVGKQYQVRYIKEGGMVVLDYPHGVPGMQQLVSEEQFEKWFVKATTVGE